MTQVKNSFDKETGIKIGRGALIAGGGAIIAYLLEIMPNIDLGKSTPAVVGIASIILNTAWQYIKGQKQ